jgi:eukaryotic-like serine/threonine-protein kinase
VARQAAAKEGERQGDFVGGKYLLEECLGIGGMGEVYRATNVSLGRKVAIKLLNKEHTSNEDDVLRFLREARAAAAVRHPNVVDVFDVARDDDGTPFIVQELLSGEDLEQYLGASRGGKIPAAEALEILIPVAEAVAAAHARDVVHRDLKPANIFLARESNKIIPKVLDFGACLYQTVGALSAKERRMLIGTPHYMAPEQITTAMDVDVRADVWAMGVILYEMLVGETPFEAEDANAVLKLVRTRAVPRLRKVAPEAPERLEELVQRCLDRDRKKRFANAAAVREELELIRNVVGKGARKRIETLPDPEELLPPARNDPKSNVLKPARKIDPRKEEDAPSSHRVPSLVLKGAKTPKKRRGSSLLNLSAPDEDVAWDEGPRSASRPIEVVKSQHVSAKPPRTAADVIREADEASGIKNTNKSKPPVTPATPATPALGLSPVSPGSAASPPPPAALARPSHAQGGPRDLDLDDEDENRALDLDLDLDLGATSSRHGDNLPAGAVSSIPPVLDPRSAGGSGRAARVSSERPPPSPDGLDKLRSSHVQAREQREPASLTPPIAPPTSVRSPRPSSTSGMLEPAGPVPVWTSSANAWFGFAVVGPAVAAFVALRQAPFVTAPLGHAMRGDSPLASGVLAVIALVGAATLAARALGSSRSNAMVVATIGAVLMGIVMIIVTFSASETAELEIPPAAAGIAPLIAPIVPLALGFLALRRARAGWLSRYERRDGLIFAVVGSLLLFAALELGPVGAVQGVTAARTHSP